MTGEGESSAWPSAQFAGADERRALILLECRVQATSQWGTAMWLVPWPGWKADGSGQVPKGTASISASSGCWNPGVQLGETARGPQEGLRELTPHFSGGTVSGSVT